MVWRLASRRWGRTHARAARPAPAKLTSRSRSAECRLFPAEPWHPMRTESSSSLETLRAAPLRAALRSVPRSTGIDLLLVHFSDRLHDIETSVSSLATAFETVRSAVGRLV